MHDLGRMIKQRRIALSLTLRELAAASGISASHLGRIERGGRFPSARILLRMAKPLGFEVGELFALAGFLPSAPSSNAEEKPAHTLPQLDPYVAKVLAKESFEVQRCAIGILGILKSLDKSTK